MMSWSRKKLRVILPINTQIILIDFLTNQISIKWRIRVNVNFKEKISLNKTCQANKIEPIVTLSTFKKACPGINRSWLSKLTCLSKDFKNMLPFSGISFSLAVWWMFSGFTKSFHFQISTLKRSSELTIKWNFLQKETFSELIKNLINLLASEASDQSFIKKSWTLKHSFN